MNREEENEVIHRWQNRQSLRSIARELNLTRFRVARIVQSHAKQRDALAASKNGVPPASLGAAPKRRSSKLDPHTDTILQLLERYSRRQYLHFTESMDFETTVREHIKAFEHLGGLAATCLYDNMKVVVTRWEDDAPIYNTRFLAFATHYGYKPWACQVRRPQTKGKVERPFHYVETNLLNGREFRSLDHLNEVTRWWLAQVADVRLHGTTKKTPLELHAEEQPHLLSMPSLQFDAARVVYRIVDTDGTIQYANNRYSVP